MIFDTYLLCLFFIVAFIVSSICIPLNYKLLKGHMCTTDRIWFGLLSILPYFNCGLALISLSVLIGACLHNEPSRR